MALEYGMRVLHRREVSGVIRVTAYRVSERNGRITESVTVIPEFVWEKYGSPFFISTQIPISELVAA